MLMTDNAALNAMAPLRKCVPGAEVDAGMVGGVYTFQRDQLGKVINLLAGGTAGTLAVNLIDNLDGHPTFIDVTPGAMIGSFAIYKIFHAGTTAGLLTGGKLQVFC